jgi:hypothetical protein
MEASGQITAVAQPLPDMKNDEVVTKEYAQPMRSKVDDLSVWQSIQRYKVVGFVAMAAAFSASLDGYRKFALSLQRQKVKLQSDQAEINLNGGIVSNKGFIRQFASPGTTIIAGEYVSLWGGIQSTGQTVGQIVGQVSFWPYSDYIYAN